MIKKIKDNGIFIIVFIFIFLSLWYFGSNKNTYDAIWNYGYSLGIVKGQIPYLDFTMIITPLFNFIMALGLLISHEYIIYIIEFSLILTIGFYFLYKNYDKKAWSYLVLLVLPFYFPLVPSYNTFVFVITAIILYLEKIKNKDILIGILVACIVLSKQTVGIFFIFPSLIIYFKNYNILKKRFIGFIIPILIFVGYLLITNSFIPFFNLCLFGLLDFGNKNTIILNWYFIISFIMIIINIVILKKDHKNIALWYSLMGYSILVPIYNLHHFSIYLLFFSICLLEKIDIKYGDIIRNVSIVIIVCQSLFYYQINSINKIALSTGINNFNYIFLSKEEVKVINTCNELYLKYKNKYKNVYFLSNQTSWIKAINEEKYDYFSVLNKGNYGYDGTKKMIDEIKKMNKVYFIFNDLEYHKAKLNSKFEQLDIEIVDYVIENSTLVEEKGIYKVYYYSRK